MRLAVEVEQLADALPSGAAMTSRSALGVLLQGRVLLWVDALSADTRAARQIKLGIALEPGAGSLAWTLFQRSN